MALRSFRCPPNEVYACAQCATPVVQRGWRSDDAPGRVFCSPGCAVEFARGPRRNPGRDDPDIVAAMASDSPRDREQHLARASLRYAVQNQMFSTLGGRVLDVDNAVMFTARPDRRQLQIPGTSATKYTVMALVTGEEWDENGEDMIESARRRQLTQIEVVDGRPDAPPTLAERSRLARKRAGLPALGRKSPRKGR